MYLRRVVLQNIKGFEQLELNFGPDEDAYPGWCVVTGDNGSGKTALLRAIALAIVGPDDARQLVPDLRGWVTAGKESGTISVEIRPDHLVDHTERGGYPSKGTFWAEIEISQSDGLATIGPTDVRAKKRRGARNGPWSKASGWLAIGYGPFRRLYGTSPDAQRVMMIPGRVPRFGTLFREDATLGEGENWIQTLNYRSTVDQSEADTTELQDLLDLTRDDFLRHGVHITDIDTDGVWLCDMARRRMALRDMSEGYRSALAMLVDLYRHMVTMYGPGIVDGRDGEYIVDRPALVLIDEVDTHLHPDWQRAIGYWLKAHFPLVQFVVTSHSPLVCPAADGGRIYHLPEPGAGNGFQLTKSDYEAVVTGRPDEILLTPAFGLHHTRSPEAVAKRERHALLVSKKLTAGLQPEELQELEQLALFAESA